MLVVAEHYAGSDTGRQRRANEDSVLARSPLFVVADGMGGAQAGEVASKIAVEAFQHGLPNGSEPERELAELAQEANSRIHELSHENAEQAGMGTTLTAVYVGESEIAIAHVGDSRAYCLRDGELLKLTDDHSLVDELMRQGRLTPEEAVEHPQRSVITRALGPEGAVEVDTRSFRARAGDVYLVCSDGLTTMLSEEEISSLLSAGPTLRAAGESLIAAANAAGGRDNITVILLRVREVAAGEQPAPVDEHVTMTGMPAVTAPEPRPAQQPPARVPREPSASTPTRARRPRRIRHAGAVTAVVVLLGLVAVGAYIAMESVYFIGTNSRGLVTLYRGLPYQLPGNLNLYSSTFVSGVSASTLSAERQHTLLDHTVRSEGSGAALVRSLELGQIE
jgi:serine/threonine protein phosphatase PrpC